jgi:putative endonuclease
MKVPCVYIMASKRNGTLYTGVTSDLLRPVWEHSNNLVDGFCKRYYIHRLVYLEEHPDMVSAIEREKQIKKWNRAWKIRLIESNNPTWMDLYDLTIENAGSPPLKRNLRFRDARG